MKTDVFHPEYASFINEFVTLFYNYKVKFIECKLPNLKRKVDQS